MSTVVHDATKQRKASHATKRNRETTPDAVAIPTREQIALRAYVLYEQSGYPSGRDLEFWLEAERQLREASGA